MLDQKLFEFVITDFPQSVAIIFLFYTLGNIKFEINSFYFISFIYAILPYFLKSYVSDGVQPFISLFALVLISVLWIKLNIIKSILFSIIAFCTAILSELFSMVVLYMYKFDFSLIKTDDFIKAISGVSSISILFALISIIWFVKENNKKGKRVNDII